mgnify:CR=1 FL=1
MSSGAAAQIRAKVDAFVAELEGLIRQAALEAVAEALGQSSAAPARGAKAKGGGRRAAPKAPARKPTKAGKRVRRTQAEIEDDNRRIAEYVAKNPGQRAEDIKSALEIDSQRWGVPIRKLLEEGRLKTKGARRSTQYFAA